jgi:LTXXQ motif family protein
MLKTFAISIAALALASLTPSFAQEAQSGAPAPMGHHWQMPSPDQMAAWHKQRCDDHYARAAGRLAFIEAKLGVSESQRPTFDRWRDIVLHEAQSRKETCLAHQFVPGEQHTAIEREAMMEKRLETRLAALKAQEPALDALYQSLSPEQKAEFDHQHHGQHFGFHHGGMMQHGDEAHGG